MNVLSKSYYRKDVIMKKITQRLIAFILMFVLVLLSAPSTAFADEEFMQPGKTYKLKLSDNAYDNSKEIMQELTAGKSVTYTLDVPKGVLYINIIAYNGIKVEVLDSKNKVVKKATPFVNDMGEEKTQQVKTTVSLSKGKYKLKITSTNKNIGDYIMGSVVMIKNPTSRTIKIGTDYHTSVTKGKTYKLTFEVKKNGSTFLINNAISKNDKVNYDVNYPEVNLVNSEGKTVRKITEANMYDIFELKKGKYTITFKAGATGVLYTNIYQFD